ncbi:MAG TPA: peptidoglycan-associated lipoprotein Pal [Terriglobales bacterium]
MKARKTQWIYIIPALALILLAAGCKKKQPPPPPPPPAAKPPAPTAMLTANPNTIAAGEASTLTWNTDFASDVTIDGIGRVDPKGSTRVTPTESTTYHLVAKNDSGTTEATARVTVTPAAAPPPTTATREGDAQLFSQNMKDIFFEYDSYEITSQYQSVVQANARFLEQHPNITFLIEGHCDERGSIEYNLTLGEYRANAAKQALVAQGVSAARIRTISYGKEKPFCTESTESCWQQNRRAHFVYSK